MRAVLLVVAVVALVSAVASAQEESGWVSGNDLKEDCRGEDDYDIGKCISFAAAVAGIIANEQVSGWRACIPDGVTLGQLQDIIVKHLDGHPEKLHLSATSTAARAIAEAFPCPK